MAATHPKLRPDLQARSESPDSGSSVIIKDPVLNRFYRFTAVQAAVLQALDGGHDAGAIAAAASQNHGTPIPINHVEEFVEKLRNLLLLDDPYCWAKIEALSRPRHRFLKNILSIKIRAFDPDPLITRLAIKLRFMYSSAFIAIVLSLITIAVILSILNWKSIFLSLGTLVNLYSLPLVVAVAFTVITIHEFAHGITLKHYGGKVGEMGFLVLYFFPAFYCNVSDAWLLNKKQRLWVSLAGCTLQIFIWAVATIMWRLLAPETLGSRVCLIVIAFCGILTLFNFNPLMRLDGYYLLSDTLEIPNLRQKSYNYLKQVLSRWAFGNTGPALIKPGPRERRVYAFFGIGSLLFSVALLIFVFQRLGRWLVHSYQGWGVIALSSLLIMSAPAVNREKMTSFGKAAQMLASRLKKSPIAISLLLLLIVVSFLPWELKVAGDFTLLPNKNVLVNAQVEGTLKNIYVDEGTRVRANDVLAEIENLDIHKNYQDTKGELASQRATLALLLSGSRPEEIARAKQQVETKRVELSSTSQIEQERKMLADSVAKKEAELKNARTTYDRTRQLMANGLIAQNEVDRDRTAYEVLEKELLEAKGQLQVLEDRTDRTRQVKSKELDQAQGDLRLLLAGSRKESIQITEAGVKKLEERLSLLTAELEHLKIRTPIDGVITTPHLKDKIGEYLDKGDHFCGIASEGIVIVEMPVAEKEIADVHPGFAITIKVRGYPSKSFLAHVKAIAPIAVETDSERKLMVQGELENPDGILKSGMTGVGKILCGKRLIGQLLTRRLIRWLRTEFWEYLP